MKTERKIKSKNLNTAFRELGDAFASISLGISEKQYREYKKRNKLKKIARWIVRLLISVFLVYSMSSFFLWEFPIHFETHSIHFHIFYFIANIFCAAISDEVLDSLGWSE